ncbi:protein-tyrosine phosphatase family protein [Streptomyces halobius]|uniref:Protein phosphatase n=1 Tax=Streptomyces halobius TaxID=2879846 RepID=A0ABY4LZG4_9ACTN|nr:protein-tyrosine phosphatase family protein [Streptomyces halobius]UQA90894.1 protein phosphatase [Streptomyces halobius]
MTDPWNATDPGVLRLPSGRLFRGRALRRPLPAGTTPTYAVYLLGKQPPEAPWQVRWLRWPDFWLPSSHTQARAVLGEAWDRAGAERVEIACGGGRGRTGTALACLAVLDGVPAERAVEFVRRNHDSRAVETPWQKRYVRRFAD